MQRLELHAQRGHAIEPMQVERAIELALAHHRAGRLAEAETLYRQVLQTNPDHADANHLLGVLAHQLGHSDVAESFIRRAIEITPMAPEFHNNLGEVLRVRGQLDDAVECFIRAVALDPEYADGYLNLGLARRQQNQLDAAEAAINQAIQIQPRHKRAHVQLAAIHSATGRFDRAVEALSKASAIDPADADVHMQLSIALKQIGRIESSTAEARRATQLKPESPEAHQNLGVILQSAGRMDDAINAFAKAIELRPGYADAWNNLGFCLMTLEQLADAIAALREALRFAPNSAPTHANLANALAKQGRTDEAIAEYRRAIELRSDLRVAHENLLLTLNYDDRADAAMILDEHKRWAERHAGSIRVMDASPSRDRDPDRRLRIGYVSPDFRQHSVAHFIEPLLAAHDRTTVEVICYSDVVKADEITQRLRALADQWHDVRALSDDQLAQKLRSDVIDILVDLAGHTSGNRLLAFARKPAPIQLSYLGYPNTTGLPQIEYRLADADADPPGITDAHFTEKLLRLPRCAWCYRPPEQSPDVAPSSGEHITFGSFNKSAKISSPVMRTWARLLEAIPDARLIIKSTILHDESARQHRLDALEQHGVPIDRVELIGRTNSMADHLAHYHRIDIALDTFPYNGTTTTCDALWMGVPVVTLAGERHISRVGVSLLRAAGLDELIARDADDYVRIAADLARDRARLRDLHRTLRARMQRSPLMDAPILARAIEDAYRTIWRQWCAI